MIVDASVALTWSLEDERGGDSNVVLDYVAAHGALAPTLWTYEVANVLALLVRKKRIEAVHATDIGAALDALNIVTVPPETARWRASTTALAQRHALTVYDAS